MLFLCDFLHDLLPNHCSGMMLIEKNKYTQFRYVVAASVALVLLFHFWGVTVWRGVSGRSLFGWLYMMWSQESTEAVDYSHGMVIPLISLWLVWRERKMWQQYWSEGRSSAWGVFLLAGAMVLHAAGLRMQIPHLSALAFILSLWSLIWVFLGQRAAWAAWFPVGFLLFAIPVAFLAHATFPLRMLGSVVSAWILNGIGIPTTQVQTAVVSTAGQGFALDVADACSGIRSIMALLAITAVYAYLSKKHWFARLFLFAMSIPVAVAANIGRIVTIAIVARFWGQDVGMKLYHDYSGYLVFVLCIFMVMGVSSLMHRSAALCRRRQGGATCAIAM